MHKQIEIIRALVEDADVRLVDDTGRVTESSLVTKIIPVIRIVVNRSVAKAFQSSTFSSAVEIAVKTCVVEPHVVNDVAICTVDASAFKVPVAKFGNNEAEKRSFEESQMDQYGNASNKAVMNHKT